MELIATVHGGKHPCYGDHEPNMLNASYLQIYNKKQRRKIPPFPHIIQDKN